MSNHCHYQLRKTFYAHDMYTKSIELILFLHFHVRSPDMLTLMSIEIDKSRYKSIASPENSVIIDFYRQIKLINRQLTSTIDLSTTFAMIDFDRHVTSWYLAHNPGHVDIMINTTYLVLIVSYFALIALIFGLASWGTFVAILIQSGTYCPILLAAIFRQTTGQSKMAAELVVLQCTLGLR